MEPQAKSAIRLKFFDLLFGEQEGWLCLATTHKDMPKSTFEEKYFQWPKEHVRIESFIIRATEKHNIYFCSSLLAVGKRIKDNCLDTDIVWADLDEVDPGTIEDYPPGIIVQSSPNRWQAFWKMSTRIRPEQAEEYSRRLAYHLGADRSGWDLTQLFRVPFTKNFKYGGEPEISIERALTATAPPTIFEAIKLAPHLTLVKNIKPMPDLDTLPKAEEVLYRYKNNLKNTAFQALYTQEPEAHEDWSKLLWRLHHICFESGMDDVEVFAVVLKASCNKYARDARPDEHLWDDVQKAAEKHREFNINVGIEELTMPSLVSEPSTETFVDQYREWAVEATDAVVDYHNLGALILLSSIMSSSLKLRTSDGIMIPNLWGLILGDSTLTRKTTSMRMVVDFLLAIDPEVIVATDGSAEGLLQALSTRPNKTSIFYKDEVSGFFDAMNRREYLSGMPETLTALYDVPPIYSRKLRKESIVIESPAFIFFGGGVKNRVYQAVTEQYVISGFLPRFLVVTGESDINKLRRMGPPVDTSDSKRAAIMSRLSDIYEQYTSEIQVKVGGQKVMMAPQIRAIPTQEAWDRAGDIEFELNKRGDASPVKDLALPTFGRLKDSLVKTAMLLAAARQYPDKNNQISIELQDIDNAAWYVQPWGQNAIELIINSGQQAMERKAAKVLQIIVRHPGILRGVIMRNVNIDKREADIILGTLEDMFYVRKEKSGNGYKYFPT